MEEFQRLLERHYRPLERFIRFRMEGTGQADDILQETLLTACQRFGHLRDPEKFKPWIIAIAQNKCRDYYRKTRPEQVSLEEAEPFLRASRWGPVETVRETLDSLPEKNRQVLYMTFYEDMSQQEIAERLHIPVGTVKSRMFAAKRGFRAAYPNPPQQKGEKSMKKLPELMPEYTITPSEEAPFPVKWEEVMGWFIVPRVGEKLQWAMYEFPEKKRTMRCQLEATGKTRIHGIEGVEIQVREYEPVPSEQVDAQNPVERTLVAQLTDTHCRILAESHTKQGVKEVYTFLDGDDFLENWGFGPDNCGNETNLAAKGTMRCIGDAFDVDGMAWPLDVVGRYTVTIGGKSYDTICVVDVECYDSGVASETYLDENGRTILWRRFNRDDWACHHFRQRWTEKLPHNERITINGVPYVHWYDCITDYIL